MVVGAHDDVGDADVVVADVDVVDGADVVPIGGVAEFLLASLDIGPPPKETQLLVLLLTMPQLVALLLMLSFVLMCM